MRRKSLLIIAPYTDIYATGVRKLAAYLNAHGHRTEFIFVPPTIRTIGHIPRPHGTITQKLLQALVKRANEHDVVGYSGMFGHMPAIRQIGRFIKEALPDKIQLWGGTHAIQAPEYAIRETYLDGICVGEGELSTLTLLTKMSQGDDWRHSRGFHFRKENTVIKNPAGDYVDLDALPFADIGVGEVAIGDAIRPIDESIIKQFFGTTYWTQRSRGCPFRCSYCIHSRLVEEKNNPVRWNSPEYFVAEATLNLDRYPFLNGIFFTDETFTVQSSQKLREFFSIYKNTIGLPYTTYVDPFSANPEKLDIMFDGGMIKLKMGIQTGSSTTSKNVFDRPSSVQKVVDLTQHVSKHWSRGRSLPAYDVITDIPWETKKERDESFRNLSQLGTPFYVSPNGLLHIPGTPLFRRALAEGIVTTVEPTYQVFRPEPLLKNIITQLIGTTTISPRLVDLLIALGINQATIQLPLLSRLIEFISQVRRGIYQVNANDPTIVPWSWFRVLRRLGFMNTRGSYDKMKAARVKYLQANPIAIGDGSDVLINMQGRETTFGSFGPRNKDDTTTRKSSTKNEATS